MILNHTEGCLLCVLNEAMIKNSLFFVLKEHGTQKGCCNLSFYVKSTLPGTDNYHTLKLFVEGKLKVISMGIF